MSKDIYSPNRALDFVCVWFLLRVDCNIIVECIADKAKHLRQQNTERESDNEREHGKNSRAYIYSGLMKAIWD